VAKRSPKFATPRPPTPTFILLRAPSCPAGACTTAAVDDALHRNHA